jgi:putative transcriptional regulator
MIKTTQTKKPSRAGQAILEMAEGQRRLGIMDQATFEKITIRHLGNVSPMTAKPLSAAQIKLMRERTHLSQAAFAQYIGVTTSLVSKLERGAKPAQGPVLAILNVIRKLGFEAIQD